MIDGVTFTAALGAEAITVRLIGNDLPEQDACLLDRANSRLVQLLQQGRPAFLLPGSEEADSDGPLLRYVWIVRNNVPTFLNEKMISDGYVDLDANQIEADRYSGPIVAALERA